MAILIHSYSRQEPWRAEFESLLGDEDLRWWPDYGDPDEIEFVIAWLLPREALAAMTNLRAIFSLGAGTEQWQKPGMPDVPVVRLADPAMADQMAAYALSYVVRHQRAFIEAESQQEDRIWKIPESASTATYSVGILGHGTIGSRIGQAFLDLGYPVNAWSRSPQASERITHYAGLEALDDFLGASSAVINVLPSTESTIGLLDATRWAQFRAGALFVNVGRGTVVADEAELIAAIDEGPLSGAVLDVTSPEPPGADSPLWSHPLVTLTPHLSGVTQIHTAARLIAANLGRFRAGLPVEPLLDRTRGY
ncbi:MAG: glyoxylate/hydroxypyruvate reductase A [Actinomycetota bacterium]